MSDAWLLTLMMGTERVSETLVFIPQVTRLIAREQFNERVHRESCKFCLFCFAWLFVAFGYDGEFL